jgi:FAD/FMN-containing dehydrogenase
MTQVDAALVAELSSRLRGTLVHRGSPDYDDARALFNAMIDRRPLLIAYPVDADDVAAAVVFGREAGLDIAVRCGAHNGPGLCSVDDGLVIDLSAMRGVEVDPDARTARVLGGTLLGEVDAATHEHGLAAPFGIISTTGVGGLTLGGGVGHLTRKLGLSIDNLLEADVVLADGSQVTANEDRHPDLYWALRGGGGNFGVVTAFTFRLSPISTVITGPMFWPLEQSADILGWYAEFMPKQPDELNGFFAFLSVPPGDPFPAELHLQKVCAVVWCYAGTDETEAARLLEPARKLGPILDAVGPVPFPGIQSAFDGVYPPGDQWYWRADYLRDLPAAAVEANVKHGSRMPTWKSSMHMYPIDGAAARVPSDASAWPARDAKWAQVIIGVDPDPANASAIRDWTVEYWEAVQPYSTGGAYVNFMMDEGQERVHATYGPKYERLATIKAKYDPGNVFHVNQNIRPG